MHRVRFLYVCMFVAVAFLLPPIAKANEPPRITVMTRNLYLGADVYAAAQFLPDIHAVAQYLWEHMRQTSFDARADAFADEVVRVQPDVIGLQEAAQWYCRDAYAGRAETVYDYTELFIQALARRGLAYEVATVTESQPARHLGFSIPTVPFITTVSDTQVFSKRYVPKPHRAVLQSTMCC